MGNMRKEEPPLSGRARALRGAHVVIAAVELGGVAYIWTCAVTGRRDRLLQLSIVILSVEAAGLLAGCGDCPLGRLQKRWGDPIPLFEIVLPKRAARAAVPVLAAVSLAGVAGLLARRPSVQGSRKDADGC